MSNSALVGIAIGTSMTTRFLRLKSRRKLPMPGLPGCGDDWVIADRAVLVNRVDGPRRAPQRQRTVADHVDPRIHLQPRRADVDDELQHLHLSVLERFLDLEALL